MSLGPSIANNNTANHLMHLSIDQNQDVRRTRKSSQGSTSSTSSNKSINDRYSYKTCPICSQRLLVRINGSFVYKWVSTHFSTHHHEWMHVIVNLHQS